MSPAALDESPRLLEELETMDDRMQPARVNVPSNHSAPAAPAPNEIAHGNGRREATADERASANRSSTDKPALTERERRERWPVD